MDRELITNNEVNNDEKTIHLYFNPEIGLYVAYGFSAFFVHHIVNDIICSFSEDLQMPVALLKRAVVEELKKNTVKQQHDHHKYYRLELRRPIRLYGYVRWGKSVKW
jgi:hypothetical protein